MHYKAECRVRRSYRKEKEKETMHLEHNALSPFAHDPQDPSKIPHKATILMEFPFRTSVLPILRSAFRASAPLSHAFKGLQRLGSWRLMKRRNVKQCDAMRCPASLNARLTL